MKIFIHILLITLAFQVGAQSSISQYILGRDSVGSVALPTIGSDAAFLLVDPSDNVAPSKNITLFRLNQLIGGGNFDQENQGRTITRTDFDALAGTTFTSLEDVFFPAEPPTASLQLDIFSQTNGNNRTVEVTAAGTTPGTALWVAGRQASTPEITQILVNGVSQSFSQPTAPGTVNGTQAFTITNNINTTISMSVATTAGNANDNVSITWLFRRYFGVDADGVLDDSELIASGGQLSSSRAVTFNVNPSNEFVFFAYPQSFGNLTSIRVNDFESISAFTLTTQLHLNASGGQTTYNVYVSNNQFNTPSTIVTQ